MRAIVKVFAVRTVALAVLFGVAGLAVLPTSSAAAPKHTPDYCLANSIHASTAARATQLPRC